MLPQLCMRHARKWRFLRSSAKPNSSTHLLLIKQKTEARFTETRLIMIKRASVNLAWSNVPRWILPVQWIFSLRRQALPKTRSNEPPWIPLDQTCLGESRLIKRASVNLAGPVNFFTDRPRQNTYFSLYSLLLLPNFILYFCYQKHHETTFSRFFCTTSNNTKLHFLISSFNTNF